MYIQLESPSDLELLVLGVAETSESADEHDADQE